MRLAKIAILIAAAAFAAASYWLLYAQPANGIAEISVNGSTYNVYVANTVAQQEIGLSGRSSIGDCSGFGNCAGMLFVYKNDSLLCFWMKDTRMPLEQYWIENGTITSEGSEPVYSLNSTCNSGSMVLETAPGFPARIGQRVEIERYLS
jgi:uncharacterized membrane protein (UPF0127 family)